MGTVEEMMCVVYVDVTELDIVVMDVVLTSTLCTYDLRKGDSFVLSWSRV